MIVIKPQESINQAGFTGPVGADDGQFFPGCQFEMDAGKSGGEVGGISQGKILDAE